MEGEEVLLAAKETLLTLPNLPSLPTAMRWSLQMCIRDRYVFDPAAGTAKAVYTPSGMQENYCMASPIAGADGTLYSVSYTHLPFY